MPTLDRRLCGLLLFALSLAGCTPRYVAPRADEPHAVLKTRFVHHAALGPALAMRLWVGDAVIARDRVPVARAVPPAPRTFAHRIRPEIAVVRAESTFFHTVTQMVPVTVTDRYACGTERSGYGSNASTRTRYCTRSRTEMRSQTQTVNDGACQVGGAFLPEVGHTYVLQYDFYADRRCTAQVLEQVSAPDGSFQLIPVREVVPPAG
ncbi:MAG: hypothetical protein H6722_23100 [Sandaracinus sp.]|nr:hypothetical protein [Myxococcales bacterium]MCB9615332.1 hypothetical protein [Sandaracinus sp.]